MEQSATVGTRVTWWKAMKQGGRDLLYPRELDWTRENRPAQRLGVALGLAAVALGYFVIGLGGILTLLRMAGVHVVADHWNIVQFLFVAALVPVSLGGLLVSTIGSLKAARVARPNEYEL